MDPALQASIDRGKERTREMLHKVRLCGLFSRSTFQADLRTPLRGHFSTDPASCGVTLSTVTEFNCVRVQFENSHHLLPSSFLEEKALPHVPRAGKSFADSCARSPQCVALGAVSTVTRAVNIVVSLQSAREHTAVGNGLEMLSISSWCDT